MTGFLVGGSTFAMIAMVVGSDGWIVALGLLSAIAVGARAHHRAAAGRTELVRATREQAELLRATTLAAHAAAPGRMLSAIAREAGEQLAADVVVYARTARDGSTLAVAGWSAEAGGTLPLGGAPLAEDAIADHLREAGYPVAASWPIAIGEEPWGVMVAAFRDGHEPPTGALARMGTFTEFVANALEHAGEHAKTRRAADEQAALSRVAKLVARQPPAQEVLRAVAEEISGLLSGLLCSVNRYGPDASLTCVASHGAPDSVGVRLPVEGENVASRVLRTGVAARKDDYADADGPVGAYARGLGVQSAVGVPIRVDGRVWGVIIVASKTPGGVPADAEPRLSEFTQLVAMAITNLEARSAVVASRARVVAAVDDERRRVVRDLHEGAQQRLVHTVITLKLARRALERGIDANALVGEALDHAEQATADLRELAHGILPAVLAVSGLLAGIEALASRMSVPTDVQVAVGRLPQAIEETAYLVVAEALANVAKHAEADRVVVTVGLADEQLCIDVRDDGRGGARADGTGLLGLSDRLAVLDGCLGVDSPPGGGTHVRARIPVAHAV